VGFHFRGTKADKCREVTSLFKRHQPGALKFNPSLLTLGNSQLATSSNDICARLDTSSKQLPRAMATQQCSGRKADTGSDDGGQSSFPASVPQHLTSSPRRKRGGWGKWGYKEMQPALHLPRLL